AGRWVRRNRVLTAALSAAAVVGLVLGSTGLVWHHQRQLREQAEQASRRIRAAEPAEAALQLAGGHRRQVPRGGAGAPPGHGRRVGGRGPPLGRGSGGRGPRRPPGAGEGRPGAGGGAGPGASGGGDGGRGPVGAAPRRGEVPRGTVSAWAGRARGGPGGPRAS